MERPLSPSLILNEAPPSPLDSDDLDNLLLNFDPIDEWLLDLDQLHMSGDDVKVLESDVLGSNKEDQLDCTVMGCPATEVSDTAVEEEFFFPLISEGINVSLVEDADENTINNTVLERLTCAYNDHKTAVTCSLDDANATGSSGVFGSEESGVVSGYTGPERDNVSSFVKVANESDEESSGTESDQSHEEVDDSDDSDTSSSSSSSSEKDSEGGYQDTDDIMIEYGNNIRGGRGLLAEGELEEGEIRDDRQDEMVFGSEEDEDVVKGPIRSKNEIEDLPPVQKIDVTLERHHKTLPVGVVSAILDKKVIVEGFEEHSPLNEGSILWISEMRLPLGLVDEIFGPVKNPFYVLRYNSADEIPSGISVGSSVSFVQEFATHILNHTELYKKAYDASGDNDEELSDEVEFSDDEREAEYRKSLVKRGNSDRKSKESFNNVNKRNFRVARPKKDMPPPIDGTQVVDKLSTGAVGRVEPPVTASNFGCSSYSSFGSGNACASSPATSTVLPLAPQMSNTFSLLSQQLQQQLNALWLNGFSNLLQQVTLGGFAFNMLPGQFQGNQSHPQLHQTQSFHSSPNGMPFQHQFISNLQAPPTVPWFGEQVSHSTMPFGPFCIGNSSRGTPGNMQQGIPCSEQNFGWPPPSTAQAGARPPRPHSPRLPFRGAKPQHNSGNRSHGRGDQSHNTYGTGCQPPNRVMNSLDCIKAVKFMCQ